MQSSGPSRLRRWLLPEDMLRICDTACIRLVLGLTTYPKVDRVATLWKSGYEPRDATEEDTKRKYRTVNHWPFINVESVPGSSQYKAILLLVV